MTLDEAIKAAMEYEGRVYRTYLEAKEQATDAVGKRVFTVLCNEEKGHLAYLKERLEEWEQTGRITVAELETAIPTRASMAASIDSLKQKVDSSTTAGREGELELLERALEVENETSAFYKRMVAELDADGRRMFERFVEIEEGHQAIVKAEIDCLSGSGFWFDTPEFSLEP
jgi:rubrerythrin